MTIASCERLIKHYETLIANPDLAFPADTVAKGGVKAAGRDSGIKEAQAHLDDMKRNLEIRDYISKNPGVKLKQETVLSKLKVPQEAITKEVVKPEKKEESKVISVKKK